MKLNFFVLALLIASFSSISAQSEPSVSNLGAQFDDCKAVVTFNLTNVASDNPVDLVLLYSPDGGTTWLPCGSVEGDITKQTSGSKTITWDNSADKVRYGYVLFMVDIPPVPEPSCTDAFMQMVYVRGGTFQMGCTDGVPGWGCFRANELPVHEVDLSSFCIGKYEVTQKQWFDIMGSLPDVTFCESEDYIQPQPNPGDDVPIYNVSWDEVQVFISKLNFEYPGMNYRLPTEAEWEYAARGGKYHSSFVYSGSDDVEDVAWYLNNSIFINYMPRTVGGKADNALGILDMSGNVYEYCSDWYSSTYYNTISETQTNPTGPSYSLTSERVMRGGSFASGEEGVTVSYREGVIPSKTSCEVGFRLVCDPPISN